MKLTADSSINLHAVATVAGLGEFSISSVGVVAEQQLNSVHQGQVIAAFERCFYVKTATGIFCVGIPEIGRGPLNALLGFQYKRLPFNVTAGEHVRISSHQITLDDRRIIDGAQACAYHCEVSFAMPTPEILQRNRKALATLRGMPDDGFFWLLGNHISCGQESAVQSALRRSTSVALNGLVNWLQTGIFCSSGESISHDASAALGLLGAGPGLTPAGDDVIAGVMLALTRLQRSDLTKSLWNAIAPRLAELTNAISAAHLEQAAKGFCGEPMNDLLNEVFQAEEMEATTLVTALNCMGGTSGWDTLGGAVMVIDAWQYSLHTTHRTATTC